MSNVNNFVLEERFGKLHLKKYTGNEAHVVIPDDVIYIDGWAFRDCADVVSIHIPDSVTQIGHGAFKNCTSLKEIRIPKVKSTYEVGESAFVGCASLADTDGLIICNDILYQYIGNAEIVRIPEGVTAIGQGCFATCYSVKEVFLPSTVTELGYYAFGEMNNITIHIPKEVAPKVIRDGAFEERGYDEYEAHFNEDRKSTAYVLDFECENSDRAMYLIVRLAKDYTSDYSTFETYTNFNGINFATIDEAVISGKRYKAPDKLHSALLRMTYPKDMDEYVRSWYVEFLQKNVKKAVALACECDNDLFIKTLIAAEAINDTNKKAMAKLIAAVDAPKCLATIEAI